MSGSDDDALRNPALGLGMQFAVAFGLAAWGGVKLDQRFDTRPWWLLAMIALAFLYGGWEIYKVVAWANERERRAKAEAEAAESDEMD